GGGGGGGGGAEEEGGGGGRDGACRAGDAALEHRHEPGRDADPLRLLEEGRQVTALGLASFLGDVEDVESKLGGGGELLVRLDRACLDVGGEARRLPCDRERVDPGNAVGGLGEPERLPLPRAPGRPRGPPAPPAWPPRPPS